MKKKKIGDKGNKFEVIFFYLPWQVPNRREGQCAPIVTLQVLLDDVRRLGIAEYPVLAPETVVLINNVIEAPVPVKDHQ